MGKYYTASRNLDPVSAKDSNYIDSTENITELEVCQAVGFGVPIKGEWTVTVTLPWTPLDPIPDGAVVVTYTVTSEVTE